ncbi:SDR family oxidoreductase [Streptomyces sp. MAR4 CNY-716]
MYLVAGAGGNVGSEEAVRAAGVPWTVARPSAFAANTLRWLPQLRSGDLVRGPFADVPVACVDPYDVGEVVADTLLGDGHEGRVYELSGPEPLLPGEQVAVLGDVGAGPRRRLRRPTRRRPVPNAPVSLRAMSFRA